MELSHNVAFYVPSTSNVTGKISAKSFTDRVDEIVLIMARLFGGTTLYKTEGAYETRAGQIVKEDITIVMSYADEQALSAHREKITKLAEEKRDCWQQESIMVEFDHVANII